MRYRIKDDAWAAFVKQQNWDPAVHNCENPGFQEVLHAPNHPPFNEAVELMWPRWWWKMSEVESEE
jgi:hypothetical protein